MTEQKYIITEPKEDTFIKALQECGLNGEYERSIVNDLKRAGYTLTKTAPDKPLTVADVPVGAWYIGVSGRPRRKLKSGRTYLPEYACVIPGHATDSVQYLYPEGTTITFTQGDV